MLTAAAHIGKELSWLRAVCHANGLARSSGRASEGPLGSSSPLLASSRLPSIAGWPSGWRSGQKKKKEKVVAERGFCFFTTSQLCFSSLLLLEVLHRDGAFRNVPSKWRKILIATLEQLALTALVFHMQEAILFGDKSKERVRGALKYSTDTRWTCLTWSWILLNQLWTEDLDLGSTTQLVYFPSLAEILPIWIRAICLKHERITYFIFISGEHWRWVKIWHITEHVYY